MPETRPQTAETVRGFSITGDFLTTHARNLVLEGRVTMARRRRIRAQDEKLGFDCAVLSGRGAAFGPVHPAPDEPVAAEAIAVIPHARPEYLAAALSVRAVITARGGALAHLVTEARAKDRPIVRVADALTRYPAGVAASVDAEAGRVDISPGPLKTISDSVPPWQT